MEFDLFLTENARVASPAGGLPTPLPLRATVYRAGSEGNDRSTNV